MATHMDKKYKHDEDIIDDDLMEDITDEEMCELIQKAQKAALNREAVPKKRRPFPKWTFCLIAIVTLSNVVALLPNTHTISAINFLIQSAQLSTKDHIQAYKKAVVVIETEDQKGTGFAISDEGTILTNDHVVEGGETVTVAFPNDG